MALTDDLDKLAEDIVKDFNPVYDISGDPQDVLKNVTGMVTKLMEHIQIKGVISVDHVTNVAAGSADSGPGTGTIS